MGLASFVWIARALYFILILTPTALFLKPEWAVKQHKKLKPILFFEEILTLGIEGSMSFVIAGYFNIDFPLNGKGYDGEEIGLPYAYFSIGLSCVFVPIALVWLIFQDKSKYVNEEFKATWGALYHGINVRFGQIKIQACFYLVFVARRLAFLYLGFTGLKFPIFQLIGN